jgi:L-fuculose-phosphate aldolase
MTTASEQSIRVAIIAQSCWMNTSGLNQGTAGNISARCNDTSSGKRLRMLITPSGIPYETLEPKMIAAMPIDDEYGAWEGPLKPSSEWRFHLDIMRARPEVGAIVHTHSTFATVLAITRRNIPACHYMVAAFGGNDVRCADYATFGTAELSANVLKALEGRTACLLANHGMIATGENLEKAMWAAVELETLAKQYYYASMLGDAVILSDEQMAETRQAFRGYGMQTDEAAI